VITGAVLIVEVIGGLIAGSLALLADAGHMLTDSTGLILALIAASLATRVATLKRTFGLQRAEVLAALGNALLLVAVGVWVLIQAVDRLRNPVEIDSRLMLVIAVVGALANLAGLLVLRAGQEPEHARRLPGGTRRPTRLVGRHRRCRADLDHRVDAF
jgi:cobalt-zinc-cadmium efflux system protein